MITRADWYLMSGCGVMAVHIQWKQGPFIITRTLPRIGWN